MANVSSTRCILIAAFVLVLSLPLASGSNEETLADCAAVEGKIDIGAHHRLINGKHGLFLVNKQDSWISKSLEMYGEWSEKEVDIFKQILRPGDIVYDVGANIGAFTIFFAKKVTGKGGFVYAFEPQRVLSNTLAANVALNELMNVEVNRVAVGQREGTIDVPDDIDYFPTEGANFGGVSLVDTNWTAVGFPTRKTRMITLDSVRKKSSRCPRLIKIDVEGMEADVLKGSSSLLRECGTVFYIENNCLKDTRELLKIMTAAGYDCHWDINRYWNSFNHFGETVNIFSSDHYAMNMLCLFPGKGFSAPGHVKISPEMPFLHEYDLSAFGIPAGTAQLGNQTHCVR